MKKYHILVNEQQAVLYEVLANSKEEAEAIIKGNLEGRITKISDKDLDFTICDTIEISKPERE